MCNVTETGVDMVQCNSDTTHVDVKLRPECSHKVTMNVNACRPSPSSKRASALSHLTLRLTAQAAMSTADWIIEECVHSGCQVPQVTIAMTGNENHTHTHTHTHTSDTFADHEDQLMMCTVTWVNHATPEKKIQHQ